MRFLRDHFFSIKKEDSARAPKTAFAVKLCSTVRGGSVTLSQTLTTKLRPTPLLKPSLIDVRRLLRPHVYAPLAGVCVVCGAVFLKLL